MGDLSLLVIGIARVQTVSLRLISTILELKSVISQKKLPNVLPVIKLNRQKVSGGGECPLLNRGV